MLSHTLQPPRRPDGLQILVVNPDVPPRDRDSGSLRLFGLLGLLVEGGHDVTLVARAGIGQERAVAELTAIGVDVFPVDRTRLRQLGAHVEGPDLDLAALLSSRRFDVALLSFYDVAEQYLPVIRHHSPFTRVVVDTVDVHHVRERRGAELSGDLSALAAAERTRVREQVVYQAADALVAVSDDDARALRDLAPGVPVFVVSNIHPPAPETPGFDARGGLVFVGNFRHAPNVDAALDFHRTTWPLVYGRVSQPRLTLVGTEPPPELVALAGAGVEVTGWVPEVAPHLDAARVSIAPLRYGAGVKGKIGEALSRGLPVVTTSVGAEGMGIRDGEHVLVAHSPQQFADAVLRLHEDRGLWERLRAAGRAHIERLLGPEAARARVHELLDGVVSTPFVASARGAVAAGAITAYADAFSSEDARVSLVLTVPAGDDVAAQQGLSMAAETLASIGVDPESVADVQIAPVDAEVILPRRTVMIGDAEAEDAGAVHGAETRRTIRPGDPPERWRELATVRHTPARPRPVPRAAVLLHATDDPTALRMLTNALAAAVPDGVEVVVAADAAGADTDAVLAGLTGARIVRGTGSLGRQQAWQLAAHATRAPHVVALSPLTRPAPGFIDPLLRTLHAGAALAAPRVEGAVGFRVGGDGSLWPRAGEDDGELGALALDCLAAERDLFANGIPRFARGEGLVEVQLARWAVRLGPIAVAPDAQVGRLTAPDATVIVCTRNRSEELPDNVALLLAAGARDVVIVDNDSSDDTAVVAAELAARRPEVVRVVVEPRGGLCHARNAGAAAARHELLLYLDDDARPAPGWLEHFAWTLARPGVVNVGGPISALWPPERRPGWPGRDLEPLLSVLDLGDAERSLVPPDVVYGACWAVRRGALRAVGGFDPAFGPGPEARINGDEVSVAYRLHKLGLGRSVYAPGAAVGHRIPAARVDDSFMVHRALCVGVERPRHARALGQADDQALLGTARAAAGQLLVRHPLTGELTVAEALARIAATPAPLGDRVQTAITLGELAAAVALLGEDEVLLGDLRLRVDSDAVLRGVVPAAVAA
jgi:GT2 family glycosyltransferase/glycosyltransferase involved in cell wall biosynthesis